jgi:predicted dehydrogenase
VTLLGPVVSVVGAASHTRSERTIGSGPRAGETVPVTVDTHVTGVLVHESGVLSTLVMSFDAVATTSSNIEVHGPLGTLAVPDPNHFDGDTRLYRLGGSEWETLPVSAGYAGSGRGYGIADLAATPQGQEPRASGALAYHVLDVMESLLDSAHTGKAVAVESRADRPAPVPLTGKQS